MESGQAKIMNGKPTSAQKKFHDWLRQFGCLICNKPTRIHHIGGAKMKLKGCNNPGEWYVLNLCDDHHSPYCKDSVHQNKKEFEKNHGTQKELWIGVIDFYENQRGEKPMPEHEYQIIKDRA